MERATFHKIARPADRLEYRKWARGVSLVYGILFVAGISFAVARHHQTPQPSIATDTSPTAVAALNH